MQSITAEARATILNLDPSKIREVADAGIGMSGVIPLWFGEGDAVTPRFIRDAAARALAEGHTFYTSNYGIAPLREAIAQYQRRLGRVSSPDRVCVTPSGVNALMLACQAILDPGDRVVLPTPHWPNLGEIPRLLGANLIPVKLRLRNGVWAMDLDELLAALTPQTRMVLLNSPGNPTGWTMTADEMETVLEHCRRLGIWVLSDEVYERLYYDAETAPSFLEIAEPEDRVIAVNSFSKSWAMTGWRLGWMTAPRELMPALGTVVEYNVSCAPGFVQQAGIAALEQGDDFVADTRARYRAARDSAAAILGESPRLHAPLPRGAMYLFVEVEGCTDSVALAKALLRETRVGVAPGAAFGSAGEGCLRVCFATGLERLEEACGRIAAFANDFVHG